MEIKLKSVHTVKDLVISAIVLAAGIGLYFVNAGLGVVIGVCGLLLLLFYKTGHKREGEDIVLRKKAIDIAHHCRESLKGFLDGKDVEPEIDTNENGGVIRLEIYYNADAAVAYAQLFDFSNYTYVAPQPRLWNCVVQGLKADCQTVTE
jgi:hypothetical protein